MIITKVEATLASEADLELMLSAARDQITTSRQDDGCIAYDFGQDVLDPLVLHIVEVWEDEPKLRVHMKSAHRGRYLAAVKGVGMTSVKASMYDTEGERDLKVFIDELAAEIAADKASAS
jgi:quinol monooxygenase YgiN